MSTVSGAVPEQPTEPTQPYVSKTKVVQHEHNHNEWKWIYAGGATIITLLIFLVGFAIGLAAGLSAHSHEGFERPYYVHQQPQPYLYAPNGMGEQPRGYSGNGSSSGSGEQSAPNMKKVPTPTKTDGSQQ